MMKTIIYSCPFVPAEWIAAHGMSPRRVRPRAAMEPSVVGAAIGICPYASAFVNEVCLDSQADAVVLTTACDQMRRASELIRGNCDLPVFLMNVPSTWQSAAAQELYVDELKRLGRFLVQLGGRTPLQDELAKVMRNYDAKRSALRAAQSSLPPRRYSEAIALYDRANEDDSDLSDGPRARRGVPLALVGGPLMVDHLEIFDLVESSGGHVALDGTTSGERTVPAPFDSRVGERDAVSALAQAYFGSIPDAFRRPNDDLYRWLGREIADRDVRGIIFWRYVWCDIWHAELQRITEWSDVPVLEIEADDEPINGHIVSRVQAFLEVLT